MIGRPALAFALTLAACKTPAITLEDAGAAAVASVDKSPPRAPPPLRAPHPAVPALPDLPALASHDPPAVAPGGTKIDGHPCGGVWNGSDLVPLVCTKSASLFGVGEAGATILVPDSRLQSSAPSLPAVVDHRLDGSEGPIRDQKNTPACTAFAIATAVDHALLRWTGKSAQVSAMHV